MPDPGRIGGPVVIPQGAMFRLIWGNNLGRTVYNVLHASYAGSFAFTLAQVNAIDTAIKGHYNTDGLQALHSSVTSLLGCDLTDLSTIGGAQIASTNAQVNGTDATGALPGNVALVATLRTPSRGHRYRGRVYVPNWGKVSMGGTGQATAGATTALGAFITSVQSDLAAQGLTLAIANPARNGYTGSTGTVHPARSASMQAVTAIQVRNGIFDSQRRRQEPS